MAPAKRAAQSPKAKVGRLVKVAKVAPAPTLQVDDRYAAAHELLAELSNELSFSCMEMLMATLPHALETEKAERHSFQQSLLKGLADTCHKEQSKREVRIADAEAKVAMHTSEKASAAEKLEASKATEEARRSTKEVSESAVASGSAATEAAAAALVEARKAVGGAEAATERQVKEKEDFDAKVQELLLPLKEGAWAKKDWRLRQKAISQLIGLFPSSAPESLTAALPLALKDTPDARGPFSTKSVEMGEQILKEHSGMLEEAISAAKTLITERQEAAAKAEAVAAEAAAARDAAQEECIVKENEWLEAQEAFTSVSALVAGFPEEARRFAAEVEEAKSSLQILVIAVENYKVLENLPVVVPEPMVEDTMAAAASEPAAVEAWQVELQCSETSRMRWFLSIRPCAHLGAKVAARTGFCIGDGVWLCAPEARLPLKGGRSKWASM
eukprot:CAMPEP_0183433626 /NCGR_PEP_ID=MMETSP0370-20130417/61515_1 /TAXON_ID=268820 /ORGANISM="Peridinium aciculiferum, Strain PAER-2" /LENGTH=443 /DNA_ID=CAMNT_0025620015 /DNA_START=21 /DNA_END=1350 /DNA_ORIENTATION=+